MLLHNVRLRTVFLHIFCMFWTTINASNTTVQNANYRLPKSIVPLHYTLNIDTYLDNDFKFDGNVLIQLKVLEPANNITLHLADLEVEEERVKLVNVDEGFTMIPIQSLEIQKENEFLIVKLKDYLQVEKNYSLFIPFAGNLTEGLAGYYRSSYKDRTTGEKKWLATTQFEAIDARRAFPCFDEPEMKAVFKITLGHATNYTAISNMPLERSKEIGDNWVVDYFQESVKMSTYLVAFIVSDFQYQYGDNLTDTLFRVWARKDAINQADYASRVGPQHLAFYENYFNLKYPLPKQDMIAIPDFNAGAMENWGLITYRETALLFDPNISTASSQHRVSSVIAHELAHQWFGNLVTMKWWTDLWLNEGFATYMAAKAVHDANPEWNSLKEENIENMLAVYSLDRMSSSHPISIPIGHPNEIPQIFDTISYRKGSYVLRMMNLFLGEEVFRQGVSNYLNKYAYTNAEQDDLWAALTEVAHKQNVLDGNITVKSIMDTWTLQKGYPLLTVKRDYENGKIHVSADQFVPNNAASLAAKQKTPSCWWVPLSYTSAGASDFNNTKPKSWLKCSSPLKKATEGAEVITEGVPSKDEWVIFNLESAGLFKVNYDDQNWELLIKQLIENYQSIPVANRVQLIDDSMDLANTGYLSFNVSLRLLTYMVSEDEYLAWMVAFHHLSYLNVMLKRKPIYGLFENYMRHLITPIYDKVTYELADKNVEAIKRQVLIMAWACRFEVGDCEQQSVELFKVWMKKSSENTDAANPIPKDLRGVVYCTALKMGGEKEWEFLWKQYLKSNVGSEQVTILGCLGCTKKLWILNRYLDWSLNQTSGIRKQDMIYAFSAVVKSNLGFYLAKDFFKSRINDISLYLARKADRLTRFIELLARQMSTEVEFEELETFVKKHEDLFKGSSFGVQQSFEKVRKNIAWQDTYYESISKLFLELDH